MSAAAPFIFICGADDFLVGRLGRVRHSELARDIPDEFSQETIDGFANTVDEVETAIARFRDSVQTVSMFGGRRLVWFKDVSFLGDSRTGNSETVKTAVEHLQSVLATVNPAEVAVLLTASPIDRRKSFFKWCEKTADFTFVGAANPEDAAEALAATALAEAKALGVTIDRDALSLLLARSGANTRFLVSEVNKLAAHADSGKAVTEADVEELTPNLAEGDFFEATERFFQGDLRGTLAAFDRHFFAGESARPLLSSMQNRNRLLIQLRALAPQGGRGPDKSAIERAAKAFGQHFIGAGEKNAANLFSQNPWYVGKLAAGAKAWTLKHHIDIQLALAEAFESILSRPKEEPAVLRELAVKCLG
ncbi:MAG: DNA polymerase III subunit delta [Verrucomicrobia bacterium]|nr:DNA polymerase III subunit delta [Verrucomicrobiota bacterium]